MSAIEFLPDGGGSIQPADEDLAAPRRPWWILGAVALAALAVLWAVTRPSGAHSTHQQAAPTHRPAGTTTASPDEPFRPCHGAPFCAASVLVPSEVRRALQRYLPSRISLLHVRSYVAQSLGGAYLAEREIDVVGGSVELLITLHRIVGPVPGPSAITSAAAGTGSVLIHRHTEAFVIDLQYLAPETVPPTIAKLRVLAVDPRLEAL